MSSLGAFLPDPTHVTIDGVTIATRVLDTSCPDADDVVLCHGTPWSSEVWARVALELSVDHRVFLWDMPGYGLSTMDPSVPVDLPSQSARLAALVAHWGLRSPHVVAHDIGGAVALGAHLDHGLAFADLFLWDIVTLDPWGSPFFRLVADHAAVFTQLPARLHAALVREYIAGASNGDLSAQEIEALASPWLDREGQAAFYRQIASLHPEDTRPIASHLGGVRCPVRVGWGVQDPWIPLEQAYRLRDRLPGHCAVIELEGVAHLAPLEAPAAVTAALLDWIER